MKRTAAVTLFLIATNVLLARGYAQNVYKCEGIYSQLPCAGGQVRQTPDSRTEEQRRQTSAAASRDARAADALEKERLKQEAKVVQVPPPATPKAGTQPKAKAKPAGPEVFKATNPAAEGEKTAKKKKRKKTAQAAV